MQMTENGKRLHYKHGVCVCFLCLFFYGGGGGDVQKGGKVYFMVQLIPRGGACSVRVGVIYALANARGR